MADVRLLRTAKGPITSSAVFVNHVVDAAGDGVAFVIDVEEAATIDTILVRQGVVTGTAPTYIAAFETKDAAGVPDGTILGGGSPNSVTFQPTAGNDGTILALTLDNSITVTRGQVPLLCITIRHSSGTINGSNNSTFTVSINAIASGAGLPYPLSQDDPAGWTRRDDYPIWGMRSASRSYGFPLEAITALAGDAVDDPDEFGTAFTFLDGTVESFTVGGMQALMGTRAPGDTDTTSFFLYTDTTVEQQKDVDGDFSSASIEWYEAIFSDATLTVLTPGTEYILAVRTDSTTQVIDTVRYDFATSGDADAASLIGGAALAMGYVSRVNAGAWSAPNYAQILLMFPMLKDLTEPSGGGLLAHRGMQAGLVA